jgi:hypothetical protein
MTTTKLKLADLVLGDSCGVYVINLIGSDAQYFEIIDNALYLVDYSILKISGTYTAVISIEDPANRFSPVQKTYTLVVSPCESTTTTLAPDGP